ncbi:MAG: hypothetical protein JWQ98_482 [Chlorobi bacterium]|nr:hypothetical protein [Chlorobiota bacterium]
MRDGLSLRLIIVVALAILPACHRPTRDLTDDDLHAADSIAVMDSVRSRTGIAGEVFRSPLRPVDENGRIDSSALAGALILIEDRSRQVVARVTSDTTGRFFVRLQEGTHYLRPQPFPGAMFPHPPAPVRIYVTEGEITRVRLNYDTGIR